MGSKKGAPSNNPNGRPKGSKNKIQNPVRERIIEFVLDDFDGLIEDIKALPRAQSIKHKIELIKIVTPKPLNDEESDKNKAQTELYERLFRSSSDA